MKNKPCGVALTVSSAGFSCTYARPDGMSGDKKERL